MNLKEELLKEPSNLQATKVAEYIGDDAVRFEKLLKLFTGNEYRLCQRSAWVLSKCYDLNPKLVEPFVPRLIENLKSHDLHDAVKRNTVRVLQFMPIPEESELTLMDVCFRYLSTVKEAVAIKVFSMTVLAKLAKKYPDIKNELIPLIEDQLPHGTAGIRSRGKKVLAQLKNS
ncbi:MAG: hypothetical protein AAF363_22165 [Bacteroidota bacterium]